MLDEHCHRVVGLVRDVSGQHLPQDDPNRIEITPGIEGLAHRLFRRQVVWRSVHDACLGQLLLNRPFWLPDFGDAEVEHFDELLVAPIFGEQDVVRFQVAVDDPKVMCLGNGPQYLLQDVDNVRLTQSALRFDQLAQTLPPYILHRQIEQPLGGPAKDEDANNIWMGELRDHARFPIEALNQFRIGSRRSVEHLDGDLLIDRLVFCEVDGPHATLAELPFDDIVTEHSLADQATLAGLVQLDKGLAIGRTNRRCFRIPLVTGLTDFHLSLG